jgi:hypothetical protein
MSEIKKYKKYLNFKANPRYLTRDFIVPLYTGTEPDILDDSNTQRESSVYKEFPNDMPIISPKRIQNQPYEQLELADGGSVERRGFGLGGDVKNTFYNLKKKLKRNPTVVEISKQISKNFNDLSYEEKKSIYDKVIYTGKKENLNFYKTSGQPIYQLYKQIGDVNFPVATKTGIKWPNKKIKDEYEQQIINRYKYAKSSADLEEQRKLGNLLTNKQLAKNFNINKRAVERLNEQIIKEYNLKKTQPIIGREEVQKTRDIKRKEAQLKFSDPGFEQKAKGTYKAHLGHMGDLYNRIVTSKNLGYTPAEINQAMTETLDPILKNISQAQDKLIKNKPQGWKQKLEEYNKKGINYSSLAEGYKSFDIIDPNTLEKYTYGVDYLKTIDPAALYEGKPIKEIASLTDKREINKIQKAFDDLTEVKKIARTEGLEQADISKIKNSELLTEENLKKLQDYNAFEQNKEAVMKAQSKIPASEKGKVISNLTNYLNKNSEEAKAFRTAGVVCRRSAGGKIDTECLAENIIKETEKLETGTDLQKASAFNKFKNATKLGAGLAEEVIGFGKGAAGRTLTPLLALNSALEQFTSGNYREGIRKIGSLVDLTTLVGDPLGFEKMRTEGTIEDVRGKIGKENQISLDRLLEFKDKYYQLQDINTKLQRAESATQDPNAAPESYDPDYLNELKKQQIDLNKIINSSKYQNIRTDYLNVGNAVKNEIFGRNINAPKQNEYTFETAAQEQLKSIFGDDFYNELSDENKIIFKNLTTSEKIQQQPVPAISDEQRTIIEEMGARGGAADGGRIGLSGGGGPKMGRRGFLGLIAGAAAAPDLIKAIKGTGQAGKIASKIKLEKAEGMYPWFPDLVEKIKTKGKPFEEKEIIMEASYKHEPKGYGGLPKGEETVTRHVDGDTEFLLREYPDGRIAVDIHSPRNQEGSSTPVTLYYRPTMELKYYSGVKVEPAEFKVLEKEPRYFANGPDDVDIEMSETRKIPGKNTIYGDVEAAERFATGKIENRKIIPAKQARREQMEDAPTDFIEETSPYGPIYD